MIGSTVKNACGIVALDCEMVGVGPTGKVSVLARVSIVNHAGNVLLDTFVASSRIVTDYRTEFSGVREDDLVGVPEFKAVRKQVLDIVKGKIVVGYGLDHDMEAMCMNIPRQMVRDTAEYRPFWNSGKKPSLKSLASKYLGLKIQAGEHSSVEDAQAALELYLMFKTEWEGKLHQNKTKKPTKKNPNMKVMEKESTDIILKEKMEKFTTGKKAYNETIPKTPSANKTTENVDLGAKKKRKNKRRKQGKKRSSLTDGIEDANKNIVHNNNSVKGLVDQVERLSLQATQRVKGEQIGVELGLAGNRARFCRVPVKHGDDSAINTLPNIKLRN